MRTCAWFTDQYDWWNVLEYWSTPMAEIVIVTGARKVRVGLLDRKVRRRDLEPVAEQQISTIVVKRMF